VGGLLLGGRTLISRAGGAVVIAESIKWRGRSASTVKRAPKLQYLLLKFTVSWIKLPLRQSRSQSMLAMPPAAERRLLSEASLPQRRHCRCSSTAPPRSGCAQVQRHSSLPIKRPLLARARLLRARACPLFAAPASSTRMRASYIRTPASRTRTRANISTNGTEAVFSGRCVRACAARESKLEES
jgi:hypothetical protein